MYQATDCWSLTLIRVSEEWYSTINGWARCLTIIILPLAHTYNILISVLIFKVHSNCCLVGKNVKANISDIYISILTFSKWLHCQRVSWHNLLQSVSGTRNIITSGSIKKSYGSNVSQCISKRQSIYLYTDNNAIITNGSYFIQVKHQATGFYTRDERIWKIICFNRTWNIN